MEKLEVRVGWEHIKGAIQESSCMCAIARAMKEQHPREYLWYVGLDRIYRWPGTSVPLPKVAQEFIANSLHKEKEKRKMEPFTFTLIIP